VTDAGENASAERSASQDAPGNRDWHIYLGTGTPHDGIERLRPPPPWRAFQGHPLIEAPFAASAGEEAAGRRLGAPQRAIVYRADPDVVDMVNAALLLRRPILVTGKPGTGKSTLAYSIAYELKLGPVLHWAITSRSALAEGLYQYDALARLQEASLRQTVDGESGAQPPDIGRFIRLGPLGTALLPHARPRVLLIDELDKSDIDLPNDLLHVFEEGHFTISELARLPADQPVAEVFTADGEHPVPIHRGQVSCHAFPVVVITSNGEREFPPAFYRRCMRLEIKPPDARKLAAIIASQLGEEAVSRAKPILERFLQNREQGNIATDQLLNAIYFATSGALSANWDAIERMLLTPIE
jgi:MoxR-like ATPase